MDGTVAPSSIPVTGNNTNNNKSNNVENPGPQPCKDDESHEGSSSKASPPIEQQQQGQRLIRDVKSDRGMEQDDVGMIVASKTTTTSTILGELLSLPPLERASNDDYDDNVNDKANKYSAETNGSSNLTCSSSIVLLLDEEILASFVAATTRKDNTKLHNSRPAGTEDLSVSDHLFSARF